MGKLISVIVPVYNTEKYLKRAIVSILNQTYTHFELILVDDGSADNSLQICQEYSLLDNRVRVIQQENAGVSVARNAGIKASKGELLLFIDSDDYVEETMMEVLMNEYTSPDQLIIYGYQIHDLNQGHKVSFNVGNQSRKNLTVPELAQNFWSFYEGGLTNSPCNKLYEAAIIKEKKLVFPTGVRMGEDITFNLNYFRDIASVKIIDQYLYHYMLYPSQSTRKVNLTIAQDMVFFLAEIEGFINDYGGFDANRNNVEHHQQQVYKHLLTALRMPYQTNQITNKERLNYVIKTSELFLDQFNINYDFPANSFDKWLIDRLKKQQYKKIHYLFICTESMKVRIKKVLKRN